MNVQQFYINCMKWFEPTVNTKRTVKEGVLGLLLEEALPDLSCTTRENALKTLNLTPEQAEDEKQLNNRCDGENLEGTN